VVLVLGSCGVSGGGDAAEPPSLTALARLLPAATDVGHGYRRSSPDPTDEGKGKDAADTAVAKACPEAEALDNTDDDAENRSATFRAADSKTIAVTVMAARDLGFARDEVDEIVDALNACKTIRYRDDDGQRVSAELSAERNDRYGSFGIGVRYQVAFGSDRPLTLTYDIVVFVHGPVGATVTTTSGIDDRRFTSVPGDPELIDPLATELDRRIGALVD